MFIMAVLIVIAIGVGIVAGTQTSKVYGPSWGQFTAAFLGRLCGPTPFPIRTRSSFLYENASSYVSKCPIGWTGYAPLAYPLVLDAVDVWGRVVTASAIRGYVRLDNRVLFNGRAREHVEHGNGFVVTTLGPECMSGSCMAVEYVSNGRVLWTLTAISPGSVSTVEGFLASFAPIG
jgi:hypothetical protein